MGDEIKMINIADIHSVPNNIDPYCFFNDQLYLIIDFLEKNDYDFLTISGDLFETIYRADSAEIQITSKFMYLLLNISRQKNAKVRIIKGTHIHDYDQLSLFENYETDSRYDFRIINKPEDENVFDNLKVKYIPVIYIEDYLEFKNKYLSTSCDIIVFHGLIEGAFPIAERRDDIYVNKKEPILRVNDILNCINLFAVGGHIHKRLFIKDNIWYTNSFTAKTYHDTDIKGFDYITINTLNNSFHVEFIENTESQKFEIIDFTERLLINNKDTLKAILLELKRNMSYNKKLRLDVDVSKLNTVQKENLNFIKVKFENVFDFKIIKSDLDTDDLIFNEKLNKAEEILSKNIPIENKVLNKLKELKENFNLKKEDINIEKIKNVMEVVE